MPDSEPPTPRTGGVKPGRWGDLGPRVVSAIVLIAITAAALWAGGIAWWSLIFIVWTIMLWELAALCAPGLATWRRVALATTPFLVSLLLALANLTGAAPLAQLGVLVPAAAGLALLPGGRFIWVGYVLMMTAGAGFLIFAYDGLGIPGVVTLVAIVAISDTFGYFAGRAFGGPKFWPRVSPKKTWSGTIAGWVGAGLFGSVALLQLFSVPDRPFQPLTFGLIAVLLAFAGQMGDIAESAIKRRAGVKDASNIIPGHGGFLDRLDALIAAAAAALVLMFLLPWGGGGP
ncbi:MAG: CDP-archaeol synthase [Maritimibacter sp.]|nr:CDP-archaeol synthase [Maritimibacter sp.]